MRPSPLFYDVPLTEEEFPDDPGYLASMIGRGVSFYPEWYTVQLVEGPG